MLTGFFLLELLFKVVKNPIFIILHDLQDPYNIGSVIRTADSAGVTAVIITGEKTCGLHRRVHVYSCGMLRRVPTIRIKSATRVLCFLRDNGVSIYGAVVDSYMMLHTVDYTKSVACVFGMEGFGLSSFIKKNCDSLISIPMLGHSNSISVSCSVSVFLYEMVRQRFFFN